MYIYISAFIYVHLYQIHYIFFYREKTLVNNIEFITENLNKSNSCFRKKCPHLNHKYLPIDFTSNKIYYTFKIIISIVIIIIYLKAYKCMQIICIW